MKSLNKIIPTQGKRNLFSTSNHNICKNNGNCFLSFPIIDSHHSISTKSATTTTTKTTGTSNNNNPNQNNINTNDYNKNSTKFHWFEWSTKKFQTSQIVNQFKSYVSSSGMTGGVHLSEAPEIHKNRKEEPVEDGKKTIPEQKVAEYYMKNHIPIAHKPFRSYGEPYTNVKELEDYSVKRHIKPETFADHLAYNIMRFLRVFVHGFFGNRYLHHSVVLETVAAVPGMCSGIWRHFTALRKMRRDHGYISELLEEAENERMHLLTWMQVTKPTFLERMLVISAQISFTTVYSMAYIISPTFSHRLVGFLEEEAVEAYSEFLKAIDRGDIPNVDAPEIAKQYWNLPPDAKLRDCVLVIRMDEAMHRDYNHTLSSKLNLGLVPN